MSSPGPAFALDAHDCAHNQFPPCKYFSVRTGPEYSIPEALRDFWRMIKNSTYLYPQAETRTRWSVEQASEFTKFYKIPAYSRFQETIRNLFMI